MIGSELTGWQILVVDDEPDSIEVVKLVLTAVGAVVSDAADGREGLRKFQTEQPRLVLTDLSMPEMDGWELLTAIRKHETNGRIPVIALTAHTMAGDQERVVEAGFDGYMSKPLKLFTFIKDLLTTLSNMKSSTEKE